MPYVALKCFSEIFQFRGIPLSAPVPLCTISEVLEYLSVLYKRLPHYRPFAVTGVAFRETPTYGVFYLKKEVKCNQL